MTRSDTAATVEDMPVTQAKPSAPHDDERWAVVETRMRRLGNRSDALVEALHSVQEAFGSIDAEALRRVSDVLAVPPATVFGVATFYHYFRLKPPGEHTCVVCTGTACYIDGAAQIVASIEAEVGVRPRGTTADGKLSLLTGRCFGSCSLAPAAILDGDVKGHVNADELLRELKSL